MLRPFQSSCNHTKGVHMSPLGHASKAQYLSFLSEQYKCEICSFHDLRIALATTNNVCTLFPYSYISSTIISLLHPMFLPLVYYHLWTRQRWRVLIFWANNPRRCTTVVFMIMMIMGMVMATQGQFPLHPRLSLRIQVQVQVLLPRHPHSWGGVKQ